MAIDTKLAQLQPSQLANAKVNAQQYMQRVNGLVYGADPRNGFFQGNTFYHPDLRFQITLPSGWIHVVIDVVYASDDTGSIKFSMNGTPTVEKTNIRTLPTTAAATTTNFLAGVSAGITGLVPVTRVNYDNLTLKLE